MSVESHVSERYAAGAKAVEQDLCCPVDYDTKLLKILPQEIVVKDYGCGDPSRYVREGDTVLDLGSGGGKICYMAAQLVGENGFVIGVDMTDDMLALARGYQQEMAQKLGNDRVSFRKGFIQDLALDVEAMEQWLASNGEHKNAETGLEQWKQEQKASSPLIASDSVDIVVSNCVLNLVDEKDRRQMLAEIVRVLKPGGRIAISDIVSDDFVPNHMKQDATLWSGCISGAWQDKAFLEAFVEAGFTAVMVDKWDEAPWQVVEDIEFRAVTVTAQKPAEGEQLDAGHAVIYKGPFSQVQDDQGVVYPRGERIAVSQQNYDQLMSGAMKESFIGIVPAASVSNPAPFILPAGSTRPVSETRGGRHDKPDSGKTTCC